MTKLVWPVALFIGATFVVSVPLVLLQGGLGLEPRLLSLVQVAPAIAAALTWLLLRRKLSARLPVPVSRRQVVAHTLLGVGAALLYTGLVALGSSVVFAGSVSGPVAVAGVPFAVFLLLQLLGAVGEEIGWRGVLQPLLEVRLHRALAAAATGLVWGVWHVQIFADLRLAVVFLVSTVALSLLLGYLANGAWWQRALTAGIVHWLVNIALFVLAGERTGSLLVTAISAVSAALVAALFLLLFRKAQRRRAARALS